MGFLFPRTNLHEINLDWIIDQIKKISAKIPTRTSQLVNDSGYVTREQASPVRSVNGQTGAVVLTASDVGAKPDSYAAPVDSVNGQTGAVVLAAADVGALPDTYTPPREVFWAIYGTTTNAEIESALDNGMLPCVYGSTGEFYCVFSRRQSATVHYFGGIYITSTGNKYVIGMRCNNGTWTQTSSLVAPIASPTFTGTPAAPTASAGTNTTQLATTAFVHNALAAASLSPTASGAASGITVLQVNAYENAAMVEVSFAITITTAKANGDQLFKISGLPKPAMANIWLLGVSHSTGQINPVYANTSGSDIIIRQGGPSPTGQWFVYHFVYLKEA